MRNGTPSIIYLPQGTQGCLCEALSGLNVKMWKTQDSLRRRRLEIQTFGLGRSSENLVTKINKGKESDVTFSISGPLLIAN